MTAQPHRLDYKSGMVVGSDYILVSELGQGGMGVVFKGTHRLIPDRPCAIKILFPHLLTQENWARFQREARLLAKLDHTNIVKIFTMGIDRDMSPFYVMELLDGFALSNLVGKGRYLPERELLDIFIQTAQALHFSHHHGVVHRDIKPSNIMLLKNAQDAYLPKLVDFGVAKQIAEPDLGFSGLEQRLTLTGEAFGTPYYISPEQAMGLPAAPASDVYSYGCTLFEALTGRPPFLGPTAYETVQRHINSQPPSLVEANPLGQYSPGMEKIVAKCLAKTRENRYSSMSEIVRELERVKQGLPTSALLASGARDSSQLTSGNFTGIRSDLPDENEVNDKNETTVKQGTTRKIPISTLLFTLGLLTLLLASSVVLSIFNKSKPAKTDENSSGITVNVTTNQAAYQASAGTAGSARASRTTSQVSSYKQLKDAEQLAKWKPFDPRIEGGQQIYTFPADIPIGRISAGRKEVDALGEVRFPAGERALLTVDMGDLPAGTLSKFTPDCLDLNMTISPSCDLSEIGKSLEKWKSIRTLVIAGINLDPNSLGYLNKKHLPWLKISNCTFEDGDYSSTLKDSQLNFLVLERCVTPSAFLQTIKNNKSLHTLVYIHMPLKDQDYKATMKMPGLMILRIDRTKVPAKYLLPLAAKKTMRNLQVIDNGFSAAEVRAALASNKALTALVVSDPQLKPEQIAEIRARYPNWVDNWPQWSADDRRALSKNKTLLLVPRNRMEIAGHFDTIE